MKESILPSPGIRDMEPYRVKPARPVTLRLDRNEGMVPPDFAARLASIPAHAVGRYPDASRLERKLAARFGLAEERVVCTAGADDALDRICRALLWPGKNMVLPWPTFEMLPRYGALAGAEVRRVPWLEGAYPVSEVIAAASAETSAVFVVSPNNPTGAAARAAELSRLREALPQAVLVADLAYGELADEDLTAAALALPDTVVVRTLSKAWGLAGLRIGYAMGPERIIDWLRRSGHPYGMSSVSLAYAEEQLEDESHLRRYVSRIREEREELFAVLEARGTRPLRSQGNFVTCRPPDARAMWEGLGSLGIAVRWWPADPLLRNFVRITCPGDAEALQRLSAALAEVLP